ncbi:TonB-dependent receptor [Parapedomonas caeni]
MRYRFLSGVYLSALLAGTVATSVASAQDAAPTAEEAVSLGDIVVTARRREEKLQDVPIAITALGGDALESRGFDRVTDIAEAAPNLQFTPGTGGNSGGVSAFIRGVGENDFIITADPAVALYIDGVYVGRSFGATTELLGVDRIEVLRGPQGSLFGKNTIGGAISVVTRVPGADRLEGDVRYGSYDDLRLRANVERALTDTLSVGVSALGQWGDGWQKSASGDDLGNRNVIAGRLALHYDGAPLDAVFSIDGLRRRQNSAAHSMLAFTPSFFSGLQSMLLAPCCTAPDRIDRTDSTAELNRDDTDAVNAALTLSADVGNGTLKSITAYRWVSAVFGRDGDASSAVNYAGDIHDETARQLSQEIQYATSLFDDRATLLVGAYAFREKTRDDTRLYVADGLYPAMIAAGFDPALATALDFNIDFFNRQKTTNYALFGNATYNITDALTLELGGRYTWEKKTFNQTALRIYSEQPLLAGTPSYELSEKWHAFTPRASLSYKFTPDVLGYASFSRGFRSGGFNGRPTSLEEVGGYDPEYMRAYEVGVKSSFGGIVTLNLSAFRNDYTDQQLLISTISPVTDLLVVRTENAGKSRIQGLELEASAKITPRFSLQGAVGYLDAKYLRYTSVINGVATDVSGRTPKQAPDLTASGSLVFATALSEAIDTTWRLDASYRSQTYIDVENSPLLRAPDHVILNASIEFDLPGKGLSLRFAVDNLTDKRVLTAGYDATSSFGFVEGYYNDPRRFSLTLSFKH